MPADPVTIERFQRPVIVGKLPAHGDFVARGVSHALRDDIDQWLSSWMTHGRLQAGDSFEAVYESAAPWLYEGAQSVGVLLPSIDAVGRLFPLLAVCERDHVTQEVYDLLIAAVETGMAVDALRAELAELASSDSAREDRGWFLPEGAERTLPSPSEAQGWSKLEGHFA